MEFYARVSSWESLTHTHSFYVCKLPCVLAVSIKAVSEMSEFKVYVTVSCLTKCCPYHRQTTHTTHQYTHNYKYIYNISSCIKLFWALCAKNNRFLPFEWALKPATGLSGLRVGYPINSYIRHILPTLVSRGEFAALSVTRAPTKRSNSVK